jgi:superfamily II DNA/RNA helicase
VHCLYFMTIIIGSTFNVETESEQRFEHFSDVKRLSEFNRRLPQTVITYQDIVQVHEGPWVPWEIQDKFQQLRHANLARLTQRIFIKMTEIQCCVRYHAILGRDIMAASRIDSGKTSVYLILLMEKLYRNKFIPIDSWISLL